MQDVFISYSSKDSEIAHKVCECLEKADITCWIAPRNIKIGKEWGEEIIRGIESSKILVLIFSDASNKSPQVLREVERAVSKGLIIINFRIENVELSQSMEYFLYTNHWQEAFDGDLEDQIAKLADTVNQLKVERLSVTETSEKQKEISCHQYMKRAGFRSYEKYIKRGFGALLAVTLVAIAFNLNAIRQQMQTKQVASNNENLQLSTWELETAMPAASETPEVEGEQEQAGAEKDSIDAQENVVKAVQSMEGQLDEIHFEEDSSSSGIDIDENSGDTSEADTDKTSTESGSDSAQNVQTAGAEFKVGEEVTFGIYQNNAIKWVVADVGSEGNPLLLTKDIIALKCFDGAESGTVGKAKDGTTFDGKLVKDSPSVYTEKQYREMKGSNKWSNSDIRVWLNSSSKKASYSNIGPVNEAVSGQTNGYVNEHGFLYQFTDAERNMIKDTTHKSILAELDSGEKAGGSSIYKLVKASLYEALLNYNEAYYMKTTDKVFLLSVDEVTNTLLDNCIDTKAQPTNWAIENDKSGWYKDLKGQTGGYHMWWLRTPIATTGSQVCMVSPSGEVIYGEYASGAGVGIRPALYIDSSKCSLVDGKIVAK